MAVEKIDSELQNSYEQIDLSDELQELADLKGIVGLANKYLEDLERDVANKINQVENPMDRLLAELNNSSALSYKLVAEMAKQSLKDQERLKNYFETLDRRKNPGAEVFLGQLVAYEADAGKKQAAEKLEKEIDTDARKFYSKIPGIDGIFNNIVSKASGTA